MHFEGIIWLTTVCLSNRFNHNSIIFLLLKHLVSLKISLEHTLQLRLKNTVSRQQVQHIQANTRKITMRFISILSFPE